jgi:hypothetical protein
VSAGFEQPVRLRQGAGALPYDVTVQVCDGLPCGPQLGEVLSIGFGTFDIDGVFDVALLNQRLKWPSTSVSPRLFAPTVAVSIFIPTAINDRLVPPLMAVLERRSCAPGHYFDDRLDTCELCESNTYILDPDQHLCQECPQGGVCFGDPDAVPGGQQAPLRGQMLPRTPGASFA